MGAGSTAGGSGATCAFDYIKLYNSNYITRINVKLNMATRRDVQSCPLLPIVQSFLILFVRI